MDSPKREKVNFMQPQHYEQTLDIRNTINNANTYTNLNINEHEVKGTSQSTDTSEICRDEESNFSPIKTITPPISKSAGENLTEAAPKTIAAAVNNNEETENAAMVYVDASQMSTATLTNTNPISIPKTLVNLAITTIENPEKMQPNSKVGEFAVPAIPDTKATNKNGVGGAGTSAKKKRNKSSKKREDNKARNKANSNNIGKGATDGNRCQPPINVIASGTANMKASVSMTSLPPDDEKSEGRDVIKAKLNVERPYNSLKKNIERSAVNATLGVRAHCFSQSQSSTSSFANHRYSWGSGYSYSSSSLQSSATFGLGSAKDDLWAAIQTNYNYIMDTNLLDTCKETERHLADHNVANGVECEQSHCAELLGVTQRRELSWHDPKELRKWLREMEERLELAPTLSTVTTLTTAELEHCLAEHSVLYHEIVSHARVVSACIRSATEEHQGQVLLQQQQEEEQQLQSIDSGSTTIADQTNSSLTSNEETTLPIATATEQSKDELSGARSSSGIETIKKSSCSPEPSFIRSNTASPERATDTEITEDSLERLQNRYHLLYLKAFEVQLWLDGLLRKKSSNTSIVNAADYIDDNDNVNCHSSACEEDETAATEDDLNILGSGIESDLTHNSSSFGELRDCIDLVEEGNHGAEKGDCDDGDDEGEEEDDDEVSFGRSRFGKPPRGYSTVLVTFEKRGSLGGPTRPTTLTDFEADSESSDWETTAQQVVTQKSDPSHLQLFNEEIANNSNQIVTPLIDDAGSKVTQLPFDIHTSSSATFDTYLQQDDIDGLIANKQHESASVRASPISMKTKTNMLNEDYENRKLVSMSASTVAATTTANTANETNANSAGTQPPQKLQTLHNNTPIGLPIKQKSIAIISPNSHNNKSPTVLRKRHSQHHTDISKFNRSNRKSKNCAVFYFKHLDTDNETNCSSVGDAADFNTTADGLSSSNSQTSEHHLLKSADASSDDDGGWLYSSVLPPQSEEGAGACDGVEIDEKGNICITTIVIDGMQSSAVTSSTALTTTPTANRVINDDSDKENKEARAATLTTLPLTNVCAQSCDISTVPSSQICTQIAHAEIQLTPVSTTSTAETALSAGRFKVKNFAASGSSSSYSTRSSSCSSNDLLTETTSATNTTQITQMHFQRVHRTEMELQIDANGNKSRHVTADVVSSAVTTNNSHNNNNNGDVDKCNANNNNNATKRDDNANHKANNNQSVVLHKPQMPQQALTSSGNNQKSEMSYSVRWHPKTVMDPTNKTAKQCQQMQKIESKTVLLPPRSPFKSEKSLPSTARSDNFSPPNVTKSKLSHESIKQLVLEAEHLVRDVEALKTPNKQKQKHSVIKLSSTVKKREIAMPGPIKQRVQEWLEHQPTSSTTTQSHRNPSDELQSGVKSKAGDDCEASGEASETDSVPHPGSDTSEGLTESIATCMQTSTNSFGGNSTECFASSVEPIVSSATVLGYGSSNQSLNVKIVKRSQSRRKSERPWSVSCLSQLTTETVPTETIAPVVGNAQTGLATHSISESALDSLSPGRQRVSSSSTINVNQVKASNSKGSLKRRKTRKKKMSTSGNLGVVATNTHSVLKKSPDSGSEDTAEVPRLSQTLLMKSCESMSTQQIREITSALLCLQRGNGTNLNEAATGSNKNAAQYSLEESKQHVIPQSQKDMGEGVPLMKPNFRVGSYTTAYMRNEKRLGSLAALATYMNDEEEEQQGEYTTGTEDHHSSFSETAWDNYQEKYNSENYSEGFDSDAARKLMEFGDDYRNFIDSQSDCCSSLSAANNLDSLSPPRMDSLQQADTKAITQDTIANSVDHARRRRALDLEYERRRKTLEVRRKSCQDSTDAQNTRTPAISTSSSVNAITPRIGFEKANQQRKSDSTGRKLEFGMSQSAQSLRRTSESDTSTRRRKIDDRRRSSRNLDKSIKVIPATSSSSCDDSDDEKEMRNLLQQSRNRLEDTEALKIRCHLLRPEDYTEIISTCRDNIRCLEAVLRGPPGTVLSAQCAGQTKGELALCIHLDCKCAPITRFVARTIDFLLDVSNMLMYFTLYRFLVNTLKSLYSMVNCSIPFFKRFF
uniref:Uncharacterized protein n=2 Tax=Bactrocera latifrons TaxID=174628 RepID=A0A0K8WJL6_BACLA